MVVRFHESFSPTSLRCAVTVRNGVTAKLHPRFISSIRKDRDAAGKVSVEILRMVSANVTNKTGLKPAPFDVGNNLRPDATMSPFTDHMLDATLPVYTCLYGNSHSCTHVYCCDIEKATRVEREHFKMVMGADGHGIMVNSLATESIKMSIPCLASFYQSKWQTGRKSVWGFCGHWRERVAVKKNGLTNLAQLAKEINPERALASITISYNGIGVMQLMEKIGKGLRKNGVYFHPDVWRAMGKVPVIVCTWMVHLICVSGHEVYGPKGIGACDVSCRPLFWLCLPISGVCQERGLNGGSLAHLLGVGFGATSRIAHEQIKYISISRPFAFLHNSISSPAVQLKNNIHKSSHKQQRKQYTRTLWTSRHKMGDTEKGKRKATTECSNGGHLETNSREVPNLNPDTRNANQTTPNPKLTTRQAQSQLNGRSNLRGIPIKMMLEGKRGFLRPDVVLEAKRETYKGLLRYLNIAGHPKESHPDFKEAKINNIVAFTISPILDFFKSESMRDLCLLREKEITSKDARTSGAGEFVVMEYLAFPVDKYVLIVKAWGLSPGAARKQCLHAMKCMRDFNGGGIVYGFVTDGEDWNMITFDSKFQISQNIPMLLETIDEEQQWMEDCSILIECFNVALSNVALGTSEVV